MKMEKDIVLKEGKILLLTERVFKIKEIILGFAIEHGHVLERWRTVINAMIEKIPGKPLLHKLRVTHLIESDFNLMIGILWGRRMVAQAEKMKLLGEEQGGSRKERSANEVAAIKHAIYSILRLTKANRASFNNDAKSCFDRIVMLLASLVSQRSGMGKKQCELFLKTLETARYHVKTKLGTSEESYSSNKERSIHGPGQGGRGSPAVWTTISCLIMKCLRERSEGAWISDDWSRNPLAIFSTGFVDDVTLWIMNLKRSLSGIETPEIIMKEITQAAQWWEEAILDRRET